MKLQLKVRSLFIKFLYLIFWFFVITTTVRYFFLDVFHIPSSSMENTLLKGDFIIINKVYYGSPLSKVLNKLGYEERPSRNDLLVFTAGNDSTIYIKRCIGLPGESIEIKNSEVFINEKLVPLPRTSSRYRKVWYRNYNDLRKCLNNNKIIQKYSNHAVVNLDSDEENSLLSGNCIDSVGVFKENDKHRNSMFNFLITSRSKMRKLLIPNKGLKIRLDPSTIEIYHRILRREEGVIFEQNLFEYFIDKNETEYYVFKNDFYFMIGDNRDRSVDSRSYGPVVQRDIIGKVLFKI